MMELLSPAGSMEAVAAAVQNGADAVYFGYGDFNARRGAKNFTREEAAAAADLCVRIPMEGELESLNAAVAAAVLMYETYRQARAGRDFGILLP